MAGLSMLASHCETVGYSLGADIVTTVTILNILAASFRQLLNVLFRPLFPLSFSTRSVQDQYRISTGLSNQSWRICDESKAQPGSAKTHGMASELVNQVNYLNNEPLNISAMRISTWRDRAVADCSKRVRDGIIGRILGTKSTGTVTSESCMIVLAFSCNIPKGPKAVSQ